MSRASALGPHDMALLHQWGRHLEEAFDAMPYQVGSTMREGTTYRDVDVRMLAPEGWLTESELRRKTVNLALTLWGRRVTGLPIDCQFQAADEFHSYDSSPRSALGILAQHDRQEEYKRRYPESAEGAPE